MYKRLNDLQLPLPMDEEVRELLISLLERSYSPYSRIKIASIAEGSDGNLFCGVNIENASYGLSICAERVAISNMITSGTHSVSKIYLARYLPEEF